jgi:hypothetical protein
MRIQSYRSATLAVTKNLSARSDLLLAADWRIDSVCGVQVFKRNGMDLIMKMDISLTEALCGMKKTVQTLDDRTLVMQTVPGLLVFTRFNITDIDFLRSSVADPLHFDADPVIRICILLVILMQIQIWILLVILMLIRILPSTSMQIRILSFTLMHIWIRIPASK